ncbi:magnesium/cobalt transporter CorA [Aquamicrobium sp. LC103]|uniref:magnesium/cobalt transporter CorA n=1 Tax=Aquamicrobium sp. LC103 TaxID=1120658 RepID=UPI00063E776A|nr:magnesium/cobalt transporter CorA [Aquamicrobium sp. LC103]TKT77340.1 magnesium/cobalt transporter CorA [Aquamicrobium sp. LC103]
MIRSYTLENGRLKPSQDLSADMEKIAWIDLFTPSREEETAVENLLTVALPTREEMEEIEISSRLYVEDGAYFMTATLPSHSDTDKPLMAPVTFILAGKKLITVRYTEPRAFVAFPQRAEKVATGCTNGETILVNLLESIVDRLADILEKAAKDIESLSRDVFESSKGKASTRNDHFQRVLKDIGRKEELVSNVRDSLLTFQRLSGFLAHALDQSKAVKDVRARVKTMSRDVLSLADHANFLSQKITFLLDATLGMINIEQNAIIKIFSVAAVVFLPPTLVASIYGMNFDIMPELNWTFGYPFAIGLMVLSAIIPFWLFRRRGWL